MNGRSRWWLLGVLSAIMMAFLIVPSASAQSKTLRWHRWDSDIQINADGTFTVEEIYEIEFIGGDFTFGFRNIDFSQFERIQNITVREGNVLYEEARSETSNTYYWTQNQDEYVINWYYPPTRDQTRVFTVEYTVVGGIIINDEVGDRFFWKAVGGEHAFPIESSTVVVHMPPGAQVDTGIEPAMFGPSNTTYSISNDLTSVTFQARAIPVNEEFEVGVRFPHGYIPAEKPSWQAAYEVEQAWNDTWRPILNLLIGGVALLILIGGLLVVYFIWRTKGRDPEVGVVPEYISEPPSDLPPGLAGTLVDEKADMEDIIATLVDLARRGVIDLQEKEKKVFGLTTAKEFVFRRRDDYDGDLRNYEGRLIKAMFGSSDKVELEDLKNKFYSEIPKLQKDMYQDAVESGLFPQNPEKVRGRWLGIGIAGMVLSAGVGFCSSSALIGRIDAVLCPFISLGVVSLVITIVSRVMPAKSRKGAEETAKWEAFKEYLRNIERHRELNEVTDIFDDYLPYAIAFGMERTWVNKFASVGTTPMPGWYYPARIPYDPGRRYRKGSVAGTGADSGMRDLRAEQVTPDASLDSLSDGLTGGLQSMSDGLFSMLNSTSSVFSSVPQSSGSGGGYSGGGFSSGGFSSGGGGGGGGAGFG